MGVGVTDMYAKVIENGYIVSVGENIAGTEITENEYDAIMSAFSDRPADRIGYDLMLKADLTWEYVEAQPEPEPDPTPEEALSILLGGVEA